MENTDRRAYNFDNIIPLIGRYFIILIRLYLGAWMLLNGLNHFIDIFPQPMGGPDKSSQLLVSLIETGLFGIVKSTEILIGILLLLDLFVPVALVMSMPISVVIWFNHAILGGKPFAFSMAIGCLLWTIVLLIVYLPYFLPMMRMRTEPGTLANLNRLGEIFLSGNKTRDAPESKHRLVIAAVGAVLTAVLAYDLHPHTQQSAGSGKTPATIVKDFFDLAYKDGKLAEAEEMYVSPELVSRDDTLGLPSNGQARQDRILKIIGQGSNVAVYHSMTGPADTPSIDIVDLYKIAKNRIVEHSRVMGDTVKQ